jgi:hypothetical protein
MIKILFLALTFLQFNAYADLTRKEEIFQVMGHICRDDQNREVGILPTQGEGLAFATLMYGTSPVVMVNAQFMMRVKDHTFAFVLAHECAHHALGHLGLPDDPEQEFEADCWAIQNLLRLNLISQPKEIKSIYKELNRAFGRHKEDEAHPHIKLRYQHMLESNS